MNSKGSADRAGRKGKEVRDKEGHDQAKVLSDKDLEAVTGTGGTHTIKHPGYDHLLDPKKGN